MPRAERREPEFYQVIEAWALLDLAESPGTCGDLLERLAEQSASNLAYRVDGAVHLSPRQMNIVLGRLHQGGFIVRDRSANAWVVSEAGQKLLAEFQARAETVEVEKDDAADRFVSMLAPPGAIGMALTLGIDRPTALDVGTGGGFMACKLAAAGLDVMAVDRWAEEGAVGSLAEAEKNACEAGVFVQFRHTDVTALRRRDAFNCVVASNSVHEMPDVPAAFRAVHRVLKPGGVFGGLDFKVCVETFVRLRFHALLALTEGEWRRELRAAGFSRPRVHDLGTRLIILARKPK